MRGDGDLVRRLPPVKRHPDPDAVWRFVEAAKPGLMTAASMEMCRNGWRLRITLNRPAGGVVHRSMVLPDAGVGNLAGV